MTDEELMAGIAALPPFWQAWILAEVEAFVADRAVRRAKGQNSKP